MLKYSNNDTVGVHITSACNKRCKHCYQTNFNKEINLNNVNQSIEKLNCKNILLYGGEPMVRQDIILELIKTWNNKNFFIVTNGTIINDKIFEKIDSIFLTVESFIQQKQPSFRYFKQQSFYHIRDIINLYGEKTKILHNIYPYDNDETFYKFANLKNISVSTYPIIIPGTKWNISKYLFNKMPVFPPVIKPKKRILEDGTITLDMRGIYNNCLELPIHNKCKSCKFMNKCPFVSMFPHFCNDVINKMNNIEPWFCDCTKSLS